MRPTRLHVELPFELWGDLGSNFFVRRTMFVKYAQAFICLTGGFGILDELFEGLTLVQTRKVTRFPVALVSESYQAEQDVP